jgi:hypothetical protein
MRKRISTLVVGIATLTAALVAAGPAAAEPIKSDRPSDFRHSVEITTGKLADAGTDARTYILIRGSGGVMREVPIPAGNVDVHQLGKTDEFTLDTPVDLKSLTMVCLRRDSRGQSPNWYVEEVEVDDKTATFDAWIMTERSCKPLK